MRLKGWEQKLENYLLSVGPFEWGKTDCCMFVFGAVKAITGIDYGAKYNYNNAIAAHKIVLKSGGIESIATENFGQSKAVLFCRRGDVVSIDSGNGIALGICLGGKIAAMQSKGLIYLPMSKAINGWSI